MVSFVWKFFEKQNESATCSKCNQSLKASSTGSTTPLINHLQLKHGITIENYSNYGNFKFLFLSF